MTHSHAKEIKILLNNVTGIVSHISSVNLGVASSAKAHLTAGISKSLDDLLFVSGSASIESA